MSREQVYEGSIQRIDVLDSDSDEDDPELDDNELREIYKQMMVARKFDEKAFSLQRRGEISTYAPHKGQEAAQIGSVFAMNDDDWMVPSFRETAAFIGRDAPLDKLFQRWMGDANGQKGLENDLPVAIPVGTQNLHASGIGMAMQLQGDENAVVGFTGDGSTSQGDFHESLNFAGVKNAHTVIIVQNNQYAISLPVEKQTKSDTIAQKALGYGIEGIQVDGNDVLAVVTAMREALEKAREGEPVLLEAVTYRLEDHTTSDDSTRYRDQEEIDEWREHDPIKRFKEYLKENDVWNDELEEFDEKAEQKVQEAAEKAIEMDDPKVDEMFDHVYKDMPDILKQEEERLHKELGGEE